MRLTDPLIGLFSAGDEQHFAGSPGYRNRAANDTWSRSVFAHD